MNQVLELNVLLNSEKIIVPSEIVDLYTPSPENKKSIIIFETVYADGKEPLSLFIVCSKIKIMVT